MRILLAQNSLYYPAHGGGDKSNRLLLEALSERGHRCRVVARVHTRFGEEEHERYLGELARRSVREVTSEGGVVRFPHHGVDVHAVTAHPNFRGYFTDQVHDFQPDVIILSTDDPAHVLLEAALQTRDARVVYLTRTTLALPFGPEGAFPSEEKTELLRMTDGVVGVSRYVADYIRRHSGIDAVALPISLLGAGPYPRHGRRDNEFVTLVNPCAVKGLSIFLELARQLPDVAFAAVPTWGTTADDLEALGRQANITVLEPADEIDNILKRTRAVLVPSLWAEARSRIVVEAMLRGIPVLASNVGGIPEAMLGVDYLLPVRQIERYQHRVDDQMVPVAEVPEQDTAPWLGALRDVLSSPDRYEQLSRASRQAASRYANGLTVEPFERFLTGLLDKPANPMRAEGTSTASSKSAASPVETLSPAKRALLALRLKKKAAGSASGAGSWFPGIEQSAATPLRLFCFPYAGGGASVFRGWSEQLPDKIGVCPARLPGRESRASEPPIDRIEEMVDAVSTALLPHLDKPFAFFGHSMGAMIAFELARWLRRNGQPMPACLLVAAARAPQFRKDHAPAPAPTEQEFLDELRHLEGVPEDVMANQELLQFLLPALRADSNLGRVYVYQEAPPLELPIRAYHGAEDPRLPADVIEAWNQQTTSSFALRSFTGGHFFLHSARDEFLDCLARDLDALLGSDEPK